EFELAVVNGLRELEELVAGVSELAHRETASARRAAEEATNTVREALGTAGGARLEILRHLEGNQARLEENEAALGEALAATRELEDRLYSPPSTSDSQALLTRDDKGRPAIGYTNDPAAGPVYLGFENVFRGSEELIRERQRAYVEILASHAPVLDIGCGRGELLQVLAE